LIFRGCEAALRNPPQVLPLASGFFHGVARMIKRYRFELTGFMPLLMHADNIEGSDELTEWRKLPANKGLSVPGDDRSPGWTWQTYLYHDGEHVVMPADLVVCCEVLEHAENWRQIIRRSRQWLKPGGALIVTSAGLGRKPHSCDGGQLREGEYYRNLDPSDLRAELIAAGYRWRYVRQWQTDLQSFAVR